MKGRLLMILLSLITLCACSTLVDVEGQPFEPITIESGAMTYTSGPFDVTTSRWVIEWTRQEKDVNYFGFEVYRFDPSGEQGRLVCSVQTNPGVTHGVKNLRTHPGKYYVAVTAIGNISTLGRVHWKLVVKPDMP